MAKQPYYNSTPSGFLSFATAEVIGLNQLLRFRENVTAALFARQDPSAAVPSFFKAVQAVPFASHRLIRSGSRAAGWRHRLPPWWCWGACVPRLQPVLTMRTCLDAAPCASPPTWARASPWPAPAATSLVTLDLPLVPFTCIRNGIELREYW